MDRNDVSKLLIIVAGIFGLLKMPVLTIIFAVIGLGVTFYDIYDYFH